MLNPYVHQPRFYGVRNWLRGQSPDLLQSKILEMTLIGQGLLHNAGLIAQPGSPLADDLCLWARLFFAELRPCTDIEILEHWDEIGERIDYALAQSEYVPTGDPAPIDMLSYWRLLNSMEQGKFAA